VGLTDQAKGWPALHGSLSSMTVGMGLEPELGPNLDLPRASDLMSNLGPGWE
jgi:hypothetical protein